MRKQHIIQVTPVEGYNPPKKKLFVLFFCGVAAKKQNKQRAWGFAPKGNMR
jgi:hypothetical protein